MIPQCRIRYTIMVRLLQEKHALHRSVPTMRTGNWSGYIESGRERGGLPYGKDHHG